MIIFKDLSKDKPFEIFRQKYEESIAANQKNVEAICVASYSNKKKEVNARYVNLKYVDKTDFIFFSNYNSPKSKEFNSHNQVMGVFYWNSINVQIRIKAKIKKTPINFNKSHFRSRDKQKNAIAISSYQSNAITSFNNVVLNFKETLELDDLHECPEYWGGFAMEPYYFEFWEGHQSRLNKRDEYQFDGKNWIHQVLQP